VTTPLVTRILIADDHTLVRHGLRALLERTPDLTVADEVPDGAQAVERVLAGGIDLAVLDITMPRMTGLQAAAELHRRAPHVRTLILSMHDDEQYFFQALRPGRRATSSSPRPTGTSSRPAGRRCAASRSCHAGAVAALIQDYVDRVRNGENPGTSR
jgi:DNA-binding NarL/FixJ family response regulator